MVTKKIEKMVNVMENKYISRVYENIKLKNANEPEFLQATYEVLSSLEEYVNKNPQIEKYNILERLCEPERFIQFQVTWQDDNGNVQVNRGYRVQFNSAVGPYKGGIRFHPTVNASVIKFLGFEQILKNSLTSLPLGGGKGGSDFDPKGKSDNEIMRFCQSFMNELYRHIGPNTDVPAGDIGVGKREIGFMFGQYKKIKNEFTGVITGKGLEYGGSLGRTEATGYGLCYFVNKMLEEMKNTTLENKQVIISGSGNVALYALKKATELGAKVIAMSDSSGCIYAPNGIDFNAMKELKEIKRERIINYKQYDKDALFIPGAKSIWSIKCDVALPCATQNEIDLESAKLLVDNNVICVGEGANMPSTNEAINYFLENGVCFAPAKAANCGGVMVSGFEMSQNAMHINWTFEEVDSKLKTQMEKIFTQMQEIAIEYKKPNNMPLAANILGFDRVAKAMIAQGIV